MSDLDPVDPIHKLVDDTWRRKYGKELPLDEGGRLKRLAMLFSALDCAETNVKVLNNAYCKLDEETREFRFPPQQKAPETVDEVKLAKKKLDKEITKLIREFSDQTKCEVESVGPMEQKITQKGGLLFISNLWETKVNLR